MRRVVMMAVMLTLALALPFAATHAAFAVPSDATVISTTEKSVSGAEVAAQVLKNLNGVALGSEGATVTLDVDGTPHDISLDLGELVTGGGIKSGLGGLTVIAAIGAGLFKGAAMLVRMLR